MDIETLTISRDTLKAINSVFQSIADDLPEDVDNAEAIEVCLDADRLSMFGFKDSQDEIEEAINEFGFSTIVDILSDLLTLI